MFGYQGHKWMCFWWFTGWENLSAGFSICLDGPHIEVHLPFGFVKVGIKGHDDGRVIGWFSSKADFIEAAKGRI